MTDEQFKQFMDMQFAHLCIMQGIFNCLQMQNMADGANRGSVGTYNFKDTKKILDSAAATRQSA